MKSNIYIREIILLTFIICIGLSSCISVKPYHDPTVETERLFRDENPWDTTTIATIPWRFYFQDPYLIALIEEGLIFNIDLKVAVTRIRQAEAGLSMARAAYFPNVALTANVQHSRYSNPGSGDFLREHTNQYTLAAAVTWEADIWGKLTSQKRSQYAQFLASHTYRNLIQTSLIANIANTYYSLLAFDEQLRITLQTVELLRESAESMQALMEAGVLNGAAVQQSLGLLYGTEATVPDLENQIRQLENSLSVLLGREPGAILRSDFDSQPIPRELKHGVPMQMVAMRPDVQQAELQFRSAFEVTNAARAAFYPSLTLNTGSLFGYSKTTLSRFFKPENLVAIVIGGLTQPIFAQGQLRGNLKISKAQQEEALLNFEQTVLSAGQEVSDILFTFDIYDRKAQSRSLQIKALDTAVYFTRELLNAGEANYTEVLTAQQNLLQAQLNQVSDKLQRLQAGVNLYRALGGGVE